MSDNRLTQTEGTNLAIVEETPSGGVPTTGWYNLEINTYSKVGSSFKKTPRDPISQSLQLRKGMLTDEDSGIQFEFDMTKHHMDRLAKATFRSVAKHNGNKLQSYYQITDVTNVGFGVAALGDLSQHFLVYVRGLANEANLGLFEVPAGSAAQRIHATGTVNEAVAAGQNATAELVGWRAPVGDLYFDVDGNLNSHGATNFTNWNLTDFQHIFFGSDDDAHVFATPEFRGSAQVTRNGVSATKIILQNRSWEIGSHATLDLGSETPDLDTLLETVDIGSDANDVTLALVGDGVAGTKAFLALATAHIDSVVQSKHADTAGNLITIEIVAGAGAGAGVLTELGTHVKLQYKAGTTTVTLLEALINTSTLIEVKTAGTGATVLDGTDASASRPLAGGVNPTAVSYAEVGNDATVHFTPAVSTLAQIEAAITGGSTIMTVKIAGTGATVAQVGDAFAATNFAGGASADDDGAGKTIDVYFGRYYRNVARNHVDFAKPAYHLEMAFEELALDGTTEYWYLERNTLDETVVNIPLTTKATFSTTWMGTKTKSPTGTRKIGPSTAYDGNANDGVSTSVDLARIRVAGVDDLGIATDFENLKITVKNNVSMQKQLMHLGGVKTIHGQCMVSAEITAVFTSDEVIKACRDNRTAHLEVLVQNAEFGMMWNIHAMTLDTSDPKFAKNKSVTIDVKSTAFQSAESGATIGLTIFPYLPQREIDD